jgi:hypothetical protein
MFSPTTVGDFHVATSVAGPKLGTSDVVLVHPTGGTYRYGDGVAAADGDAGAAEGDGDGDGAAGGVCAPAGSAAFATTSTANPRDDSVRFMPRHLSVSEAAHPLAKPHFVLGCDAEPQTFGVVDA